MDEALIRSSRLRPLTDPGALELEKKSGQGERVRRDPQLLVDLMLGAAEPKAEVSAPARAPAQSETVASGSDGSLRSRSSTR